VLFTYDPGLKPAKYLQVVMIDKHASSSGSSVGLPPQLAQGAILVSQDVFADEPGLRPIAKYFEGHLQPDAAQA